MKKWMILAGVIVGIFIVGYLALSYYSVRFVQGRLEKVIGPGFAIAEIKVRPTYLSAKGIRYEDSRLKKGVLIEEMRIYPGFSSLFSRTLRIREWTIVNPSFSFYRSRVGEVVGPWLFPGKEKQRPEASSRKKEGKGEPVEIRIDRLRILKARVDFEDEKAGEPPAMIGLRRLDLDLREIRYPMISAHSPVEIKGAVEGNPKEGEIQVKGWIDLVTMDMEISFKAHGIAVRLFEPYYRKRVSAEIESGYSNIESKISVVKREVDAPGRLELVDLLIKQGGGEGGGTVLWIPANTLVSLLKQKGNRVNVKFRVKGSLDDPRFSIQEAFLTRVAVSLAVALGIPIKVVGETAIEGTGKGVEELVKGLQSIEELFRKKKEKQP